jgi:hypothetical protein
MTKTSTMSLLTEAFARLSTIRTAVEEVETLLCRVDGLLSDNVRELQHHVRTLAAAVPRPVTLSALADRVFRQLTPDVVAELDALADHPDDFDAQERVFDWLMGTPEPGHIPPDVDDLLLTGPAPSPDDPAWDAPTTIGGADA